MRDRQEDWLSRFVYDHPGLTARQLATALEWRVGTVQRRLWSLRIAGRVKNQDAGPDGAPRVRVSGEPLRWFPR